MQHDLTPALPSVSSIHRYRASGTQPQPLLQRLTWSACWWCLAPLLLLATLAVPALQTQAQERGPIYRVVVEGVVTDITVGYLRRALQTAEASDATALIIELGGEGAVLRAIRPFAGELADADVPVVVYVPPPDTESGSAGAFFLSAAHIAAMAPDTRFGTPVALTEVDETLSEQTRNLVLASVAQQLREWNERRGRNTAWIDQAVREGVIRTSQQAFATDPPIIDLVARDGDELVTLLQGRTVELTTRGRVELRTLGRTPTLIEPTLWESFLLFLADPTVVFLLLVLGAVAIYVELVTPGTGIAAGLGAVLLLGALVGLVVLPIRPLSLLGLILAFGLIMADIYVPTHGGLTVVGLVFLLIGGLTLIDAAQAPGVFVALWAILLVVVAVAAFAALTIWIILRTGSRRVTTGQEGLIGRLAEVRAPLEPGGMVFVEGALWRAISEDGTVERGEWVRVVAVHDLRLVVRRIDADAAEPNFRPELDREL